VWLVWLAVGGVVAAAEAPFEHVGNLALDSETGKLSVKL
jgi:hypothetical protein